MREQQQQQQRQRLKQQQQRQRLKQQQQRQRLKQQQQQWFCGKMTMFLLLWCTEFSMNTRAAAGIGVNIGRIADDLPAPSQMAALVQSQGIERVKLYDADPETVRAFAGTSVEIAVMVPNEAISQIAGSTDAAAAWISAASFGNARITTVMVGNEVLTRADPSLAPLLVPAMRNMKAALGAAGFAAAAVTTPHAFDILDPSSSFPPSSGAFKESLQPLLASMVEELLASKSPFMVDIYPYFAFRDDSVNVPLDYALFSPNATGVDDAVTGLHYSNLLDAQLDAVAAALQRVSTSAANLAIVVSETGWPSAGDENEVGASLANAVTYNQRLVDHVSQQPPKGTPLRPGVAVPVYIFELFNENLKTGSSSERHFGLFYPNMTKVGGQTPPAPKPSPSGRNFSSSRGSGSDISALVIVIACFLSFRI